MSSNSSIRFRYTNWLYVIFTCKLNKMEKNQIYNIDCDELIGRLYAEKLRGG